MNSIHDFHYLVYCFSHIKNNIIFSEVLLLLIKDGVVQDVMDKVINELRGGEHLLSTGFDSLVDVIKFFDQLPRDNLVTFSFFERVQNFGKTEEIALHGVHLADK